MKKTILAVVLVAMLGAGLTACLPAPAPPPEPVSEINTATRYGVGVHQITLQDSSRGMAAFGDFPGSAVRTIPTAVFYPVWEVPHSGIYGEHAPYAQNGPYPVVVFAAGYGVDWHFYTWLIERIASTGYVVVAPTYSMLSGWPAGPSETADWDEHFTDTSFVISSMEQLNRSDPILAGMMDTKRVAAVGHSDGALIAFGAGEEAYRTDPRVRSVISYAADLGFADGFYQASGRPFLHYFSDTDEFNPYPEAMNYDRWNLQDPHWSISLWNANHTSPYNDPGDPHFDMVVSTTVNFLNATLKGYPIGYFFMTMDVASRPDLGAIE